MSRARCRTWTVAENRRLGETREWRRIEALSVSMIAWCGVEGGVSVSLVVSVVESLVESLVVVTDALLASRPFLLLARLYFVDSVCRGDEP